MRDPNVRYGGSFITPQDKPPKECKKCFHYGDTADSSDHFVCVFDPENPKIYHKTCDACVDFKLSGEEDAVPENLCEDCADVHACNAIRMSGQECHVFKPKAEEIGEPKKVKHFHCWNKKTGEYLCAVKTYTNNNPIPREYEYEEYEPPKCPEPDGWYALTTRSGALVFRRKEGKRVFDRSGSEAVDLWSAYGEVIARLPEIVWLDGRYKK